MNIKQLRSFRKVVELGSMTKAAEALHIAQPALGQQIRSLEDSLGLPLLMRHSRGVSLTPAGSLLFERSEKILQLVAETERDITALGSLRKETLTVGLPPSIALLLGAELMLQIGERIPDLFLSLHEGPSFELVDGVLAGKLDLALAHEVDDAPNLRKTPMLDDELLLIGAPDLVKTESPIDFAEAMAHDIALSGPRDIIRRLVEKTAAERGLSFRLRYEVQSIPALREVALKGLACVIMPYGTAVRELKAGTLVGRPIVNPTILRTLYLVQPLKQDGSGSASHAGFLAILNELVVQLEQMIAPHSHFHPGFVPA
jgi:LysR family nitrogen assimilation transcriptional regulator